MDMTQLAEMFAISLAQPSRVAIISSPLDRRDGR